MVKFMSHLFDYVILLYRLWFSQTVEDGPTREREREIEKNPFENIEHKYSSE